MYIWEDILVYRYNNFPNIQKINIEPPQYIHIEDILLKKLVKTL
jgi:hypothetical protein